MLSREVAQTHTGRACAEGDASETTSSAMPPDKTSLHSFCRTRGSNSSGVVNRRSIDIDSSASTCGKAAVVMAVVLVGAGLDDDYRCSYHGRVLSDVRTSCPNRDDTKPSSDSLCLAFLHRNATNPCFSRLLSY